MKTPKIEKTAPLETIRFRLTRADHERLRDRARKDGTTMAAIVRKALELKFERVDAA
ncbi:hypothetical protein HQ447_07315 [bacterium]|nr:hypothetical protein [bacterium]